MSEPPGSTRSGLAIVYIHGINSSERTWAQMRALVGRDRQIRGVRQYAPSYPTRVVELSPVRLIPDYANLSVWLATFIEKRVREDKVLLVTHSQGGLLAYYYLNGLLSGERSTSKEVVGFLPFACPHYGSEIALRTRNRLLRANPQEMALRPGNEELTDVVHNVESNWPALFRTPVRPVLGLSDGIVKSESAKGPWAAWDAVPGDHTTILKPPDRRDSRYLVLRDAILGAVPGMAKNSPESPSESEPTVNPRPDKRVRLLRKAEESCIAITRLIWPTFLDLVSPAGSPIPILSHRGLICGTEEPNTFLRLTLGAAFDRGVRARHANLAVLTGVDVARTSTTFTSDTTLPDLLYRLSADTRLGSDLAAPALKSLTHMFNSLADTYETHTDLTSVANMGSAKSLVGNYLVTDDGITDLRDPAYQESIFTRPQDSRFQVACDQDAADLDQARRIFDLFP
jgi:hypothetical protein